MKARAKAALVRGRRQAEELMTDLGELRRPNGQQVTDPETGQTTPGFDLINAEQACKIASHPPTSSAPESGEHRYTLERLRLHVPIGTPARAGDEVEVTASEENPDNIGTIFRLIELNRGTHRTAQRWSVEVMTR